MRPDGLRDLVLLDRARVPAGPEARVVEVDRRAGRTSRAGRRCPCRCTSTVPFERTRILSGSSIPANSSDVGQAQDPAAGVLALGLEVDGAGRLEQLEGPRPEVPVEDVALAGQQVVGDARAGPSSTRCAGRDGLDDGRRDARGFVVAGLDRVQDLVAPGLASRAAPRRSAGPRRRGPSRGTRTPWAATGRREGGSRRSPSRAASTRRDVPEVQQAGDDVGDLHAGVVEVVLDLDRVAEVPQRRARARRRGRRCAGGRCARPCWG